MEKINLTYLEFVSIVILGKKLRYQHTLENISPKWYTLFAFDGPIYYQCSINENVNLANITNYEGYYKIYANEQTRNLTVLERNPNTNNIKYIKKTQAGIYDLWIPSVNKKLDLTSISMYGYCDTDASKKRFSVSIEIKSSEVWIPIVEYYCSRETSEDINFYRKFDYMLPIDLGNGSNVKLRANITNTGKDFYITIIALGFEN